MVGLATWWVLSSVALHEAVISVAIFRNYTEIKALGKPTHEGIQYSCNMQWSHYKYTHINLFVTRCLCDLEAAKVLRS